MNNPKEIKLFSFCARNGDFIGFANRPLTSPPLPFPNFQWLEVAGEALRSFETWITFADGKVLGRCWLTFLHLLKVPRGCVHHGGKRSRCWGTDRDAAGAQEDKTSGVVWAFTSGKGAARDHANDSPICCPWPQEVFPSKGSYEVGLSLQEAEPSYQDSTLLRDIRLTDECCQFPTAVTSMEGSFQMQTR